MPAREATVAEPAYELGRGSDPAVAAVHLQAAVLEALRSKQTLSTPDVCYESADGRCYEPVNRAPVCKHWSRRWSYERSAL